MKIGLGILGGCLVMLGAVGVLTGAMGLIDPVGAQMSNDADPFGTPPTFEQSAWLTSAAFCAFLAGCWLCVRLARER